MFRGVANTYEPTLSLTTPRLPAAAENNRNPANNQPFRHTWRHSLSGDNRGDSKHLVLTAIDPDHTRTGCYSVLPQIETNVETNTHSSLQGRRRSQTKPTITPKKNLLKRARQKQDSHFAYPLPSHSPRERKDSKQATSRPITFRNKVHAFATDGTRITIRRPSPPAVGVDTHTHTTNSANFRCCVFFLGGGHPSPPPLSLKKISTYHAANNYLDVGVSKDTRLH